MRVSIFRMALHEIYAEARTRAHSGEDLVELRNNISSAISRRSKQCATSSGIVLVAAILLDGLLEADQVVLPTTLGSLSFPAIYVTFLSAIAFFGFVYNLLTLLTLMCAQAQNDNTSILLVARPSASSLLSGNENFDFLSPIRSGNFFKFRRSLLIGLPIYVPFLILLIPISVATYKICDFLLASLFRTDEVFLGFALELSSCILIVFPLAFGVLFFVPMRVFKDKMFIRWRFLYRVTRTSRLHHNTQRWLND